MMPILYAPDAVNFNNNGLGRIKAISCVVDEERNGSYELEMEMAASDSVFSDVQHSCIIKVKVADGSNQLFRIYKISKPINGVVTINAQHISYQLSMIPTMPFTASSASDALAGLKANAAESCPFTFWTDVSTSGEYTQEEPESIRARLGGQRGSILDCYGGEYEWDGYTVRLWQSRGRDRGVTLKYGKNITDIEQEENIENTHTGVLPFYRSDDGDVYLPEKVLHSDNAQFFPYQRTIPLDMSQDFEDAPTVDQLRNAAKNYMKTNNIGIPAVSISVSFVALWQTKEYKAIAPLEEVGLCDTITVSFEKLGIKAKAKIIKTRWNVLLERYEELDIGDARTDLASKIVQQQEEIKELPTNSVMERAIGNATNLITGNKGGYVVMHKDSSGKPYEILIMDTPDIATAQKVWRWNNAGLGYSSNGYGGTYGTAITQDGSIVANYITTGTLNAININGCRITGGTVSLAPTDQYQADFVSTSASYTSSQFSSGMTVKKGNTTIFRVQPQVDIDGAAGNVEGAGLAIFDTSGRMWTQIGMKISEFQGNLTVYGTKNRAVETESYGTRLLSAYETPTPYFGDIGVAMLDDDGLAWVDIDPIWRETVEGDFCVFVQDMDGGTARVCDRTASGFRIVGNPVATVAWEIKAKQKGFSDVRFPNAAKKKETDGKDIVMEVEHEPTRDQS